MMSIGAAAAGGKRETTARGLGPKWHADVGQAFAEARRAHKPVLAVLHCPH
jgi:hypothetical protein